MSKKEELEPKLAELMSNIPETEGVVAFSLDGAVISGQTIQKMDIKKISSVGSKLLNILKDFGESIGKGEVSEITINFEGGFAVIAFGDSYSIIAFLDSDSKMQLGLLSRALRKLF
ncbi:MAG: roadblock/LC7 domain-containing protein [Promethearchaeota archaeon]